jgi:hypothetical protein
MFARRRQTFTAKGLILFLAALTVLSLPAAELTALQALQQANRYVSVEATSKVLQVRSDRSTNGLVPKVWTTVFYDSSVRMKTTIVRLGAGKEPKVEHPFALFKKPDLKRAFDPSTVRVDSDMALKVAEKDRLLETVKLTGSRVTLEQWEDGPVWKIEFWAEKAREPSRTPAIGQIFVDVREGKVVNRDLHINRTE